MSAPSTIGMPKPHQWRADANVNADSTPFVKPEKWWISDEDALTYFLNEKLESYWSVLYHDGKTAVIEKVPTGSGKGLADMAATLVLRAFSYDEKSSFNVISFEEI